MTYTVKFELFIDGDEILKAHEIADLLHEELSGACVDVSNVKILEIND